MDETQSVNPPSGAGRARTPSDLRDWLSVSESARHFSNFFDDEVTELDVLAWALDGRLTLSVRFVNAASGRLAKLEPRDQGRVKKFSGARKVSWAEKEYALMVIDVSEEKDLVVTIDEVPIQGIWDLSMEGGELLEVERRYQQLTAGPEVTPTSMDEALLKSRDGWWCQLAQTTCDIGPDGAETYPALPRECLLVVRACELHDFQHRFLGDPQHKIERRSRAASGASAPDHDPRIR